MIRFLWRFGRIWSISLGAVNGRLNYRIWGKAQQSTGLLRGTQYSMPGVQGRCLLVSPDHDDGLNMRFHRVLILFADSTETCL